MVEKRPCCAGHGRHYAAALDPSITVMRNFYHTSNAAGLVDLVLSAARGLSPQKDGALVLGAPLLA